MPVSDVPGSDAYLAAIVESSDDAIIRKDLNGIIGSFNAAAERMFGYSAEEIVGKPVTMLIPPELQHEEAIILERLARGERIDHYETERITKDGRRIEISLSVSPVRNAEGRIVGASKIVRDMTERNRLARALSAQHQWFRITLASIGDGVIACDPNGRVTFLNPVAERMTGWTPGEAKGRALHEVFQIIGEQTREPLESPAVRVLSTGTVVDVPTGTLLVSRNRTEHPIADSAAPIVDDSGRTVGVVVVFHDVTAERAHRLKEELVATVSEKLRAPLEDILRWTEVLREKPQDVVLTEQAIEAVARAARTQLDLLSELLAAGAIDPRG